VQGVAEHSVHEALHFWSIQNDSEAALQHADHGREILLIEGGHSGVVGKIGVQRKQVHGLRRVRQHVRGTVQVRIECDEVGPSKRVRRVRFNGRLGVHDSRFGTALALLVIRSEHVQLSRFGVLAQSRFQQGFDHGV